MPEPGPGAGDVQTRRRERSGSETGRLQRVSAKAYGPGVRRHRHFRREATSSPFLAGRNHRRWGE